MGDLSTVVVAALGAWLAVATGVSALLVRQAAVVSKWVNERAEGDGLEIGAEVPERALLLMPDLASGLNYLAIIDGSSQQGQEFALEASRSQDLAKLQGEATVTVAIIGSGSQVDRAMRLLPPWCETMHGHVADTIKFNLKVRQMPAVYEIEEGRVTGKAGSGYGVTNFLNLVGAREHSDAADFAGGSERG